MPSNPFFSGRIPPELLDAIEKHREITGESKTDLLIKALSQYVGFQLEEKEPELPPIHDKLDEIFRRIEKLEKSVFSESKNIAEGKNSNTDNYPSQIEIDVNNKTTDNNLKTSNTETNRLELSSKELAKLLNVSQPTVSTWKKKNVFPKTYKEYEIEFDRERSKLRADLWIVRKTDND